MHDGMQRRVGTAQDGEIAGAGIEAVAGQVLSIEKASSSGIE